MITITTEKERHTSSDDYWFLTLAVGTALGLGFGYMLGYRDGYDQGTEATFQIAET